METVGKVGREGGRDGGGSEGKGTSGVVTRVVLAEGKVGQGEVTGSVLTSTMNITLPKPSSCIINADLTP